MASDIVSSDMASDIVSSDMVTQFGRGMKILRVHKKNPNAGHSESGFAPSYPRVDKCKNISIKKFKKITPFPPETSVLKRGRLAYWMSYRKTEVV